MIISEALSGNRIHVDNPETILSLDDVKTLVSDKFGISAENQLLLVARNASRLTLELVADGQQIFVYDKRFFLDKNPPDYRYSASLKLENIASPRIEPNAPHGDKERLAWARTYLASTAEMYSCLGTVAQEISTIQQGRDVAIKYMKSYVDTMDKSVKKKIKLTKELNEDIVLTLEDWKSAYTKLKDFKDFIKKSDQDCNSKGHIKAELPSLQDRFNLKELEDRAHECEEAGPIITKKMYELDSSVSQISLVLKKLSEYSAETFPTAHKNELKDILDDVKAVYEKLNKDIEFMATAEGANQRERLQQLHEKEFLTTFPARWKEMHDAIKQAELARKKAFTSCYDVLISAHDITAHDVRTKITEFGSFLQKIDDSRVAVAQVIDMPYLYGLVLVEEEQRNKWVENVRQITSSTAEQFADIRAREVERRQFAFKEIQLPEELNEILNAGESDLPQMEVSLGNIRKYDVDESMVKQHIEQLRRSGLDSDYQDLLERAKGDISYPHRFNTSTASQQTQKLSNYEQKVKGYELRIRKLENLLHRRHQLEGSPASGTSSLVAPSKSIERIHELEEKYAKTEAENSNLQIRIKELEKTIQTHTATIAHCDSVKSDLLANMKNKEEEFASERKYLSEEVKTLKIRVDAMESEIDSGAQEINHLQSLLEEAMSSLSDQSSSQTRLQDKCQDLSQKLYTTYVRLHEILNTMGLQATRDEEGNYRVNRVKGLRKSGILHKEPEPPSSLYWMTNDESKEEDDYANFVNHVHIDYDLYRDAIGKRFGDVEHLARKLQKELKNIRTQQQDHQSDGSSTNQGDKYKIALNNFKVGDLALFLPTKEDTKSVRPWAAFNIGAPHYFLKQTPAHNLDTREYLVARISRIEERVVNKSSENDLVQNPFDLSDGLRWHYLEVSE